MAKRKRRSYVHRAKAYIHRKKAGWTIAGAASVLGPQVIVNSGQMGTYPAITNALSGNFGEAAWNVAANEVMAFTGYDVGKGSFNFGPPLVTYGTPMLIKAIRHFVGPVRFGKIRLM